MDVEGHDVRTSYADDIERLPAVAGKLDLKIGLRRKDLPNELANEAESSTTNILITASSAGSLYRVPPC